MMRQQRTDEIQWGRLNQAVTSWVTGYGLLSVHIGLYLLAAAILVLINLYRSPDHFHVQGALFIWGIILLIHIGFVVVRTTLARTANQLSSDRQGNATSANTRRTTLTGSGHGARPTGRFGAKTGNERDESSLERAKIFVQERVVQPVAARAAPLTTARHEESPASPPVETASDHATDTWPHGNGVEPHGTVTQRGRALLNSSAAHAKDLAEKAQTSARDVFHRALGESEPVGETTRPPVPPAPPRWPRASSSAATSESPVVKPAMPARDHGEQLGDASVVFPPYVSGRSSNGTAANAAASNGHKPQPPQPLQPPLSAEPPHKTDPKTEWTWMEAAAAAWLARREADQPDDAQTNHHEHAASPAEPPPSPETKET